MKSNKKRDFAIIKTLAKKTQAELKTHCHSVLTRIGYDVEVADGYLYATKTNGARVMVVAHLDTVHAKQAKTIHRVGDKVTSPQGIGGDDRCGVFLALEVAQSIGCAVLLTEDEEVGAVGARKFTTRNDLDEIASGIDFIIEFDRRGNRDAVFYECDNPDFTAYVLSSGYFKEAVGSFSDISELAPALNRSAVNLSSGYYNPHTIAEYIELNDLATIRDEALKLIALHDGSVYEYIEAIGNWWTRDYGAVGDRVFFDGEVGRDDDGIDYFIEYDHHGSYKTAILSARSEAEAVGILFQSIPDLCYDDVYCVSEYEASATLWNY